MHVLEVSESGETAEFVLEVNGFSVKAMSPQLWSVYACFQPLSIGIFLFDIWRHRVQRARAKHQTVWSIPFYASENEIQLSPCSANFFSGSLFTCCWTSGSEFGTEFQWRTSRPALVWQERIHTHSHYMAVLPFTTSILLQIRCLRPLLIGVKQSFVSHTHTHTQIWTDQ